MGLVEDPGHPVPVGEKPAQASLLAMVASRSSGTSSTYQMPVPTDAVAPFAPV
ncbi:hypothetical protein ACWDE0_38755 [Streptomyces sp. 900105755]